MSRWASAVSFYLFFYDFTINLTSQQIKVPHDYELTSRKYYQLRPASLNYWVIYTKLLCQTVNVIQ